MASGGGAGGGGGTVAVGRPADEQQSSSDNEDVVAVFRRPRCVCVRHSGVNSQADKVQSTHAVRFGRPHVHVHSG